MQVIGQDAKCKSTKRPTPFSSTRRGKQHPMMVAIAVTVPAWAIVCTGTKFAATQARKQCIYVKKLYWKVNFTLSVSFCPCLHASGTVHSLSHYGSQQQVACRGVESAKGCVENMLWFLLFLCRHEAVTSDANKVWIEGLVFTFHYGSPCPPTMYLQFTDCHGGLRTVMENTCWWPYNAATVKKCAEWIPASPLDSCKWVKLMQKDLELESLSHSLALSVACPAFRALST